MSLVVVMVTGFKFFDLNLFYKWIHNSMQVCFMLNKKFHRQNFVLSSAVCLVKQIFKTVASDICKWQDNLLDIIILDRMVQTIALNVREWIENSLNQGHKKRLE